MADQVASARQKFHCPACGAEANWNPGEAGARLPVLRRPSRPRRCRRAAPTRSSSSTIWPRRSAPFRTRRAAGRPRRPPSAARAARRFRSSTPTRSAAAATSAARRRSCRTRRSRIRFVPSRCLPLKISESQARDLIRAWYGRQWLAPNNLQREGAHRHGERHLSSVLDLRCEGRRAVDRRGRRVLLRPRGQPAGAEGQVDAGLRRALARVRRRAGVRVGGRGRRQAAAHRAVSHRRARARSTRAIWRAGRWSGIRSIWWRRRSDRGSR